MQSWSTHPGQVSFLSNLPVEMASSQQGAQGAQAPRYFFINNLPSNDVQQPLVFQFAQPAAPVNDCSDVGAKDCWVLDAGAGNSQREVDAASALELVEWHTRYRPEDAAPFSTTCMPPPEVIKQWIGNPDLREWKLTKACPCKHNEWVRINRMVDTTVYLKCRVCLVNWCTTLDWHAKCNAHFSGGCDNGSQCRHVHIYRVQPKQRKLWRKLYVSIDDDSETTTKTSSKTSVPSSSEQISKTYTSGGDTDKAHQLLPSSPDTDPVSPAPLPTYCAIPQETRQHVFQQAGPLPAMYATLPSACPVQFVSMPAQPQAYSLQHPTADLLQARVPSGSFAQPAQCVFFQSVPMQSFLGFNSAPQHAQQQASIRY
ncbi:hypothetical protein DIPPA_23731 [Diplonema papillatum]|nr:hypothetical protein DIPPA_23731 [Diplonema papillatum]|eukprot:gene18656-28799_t